MIQIDIPMQILERALKAAVASLERANSKETNDIIKDARKSEIGIILQAAAGAKKIK